MDAPGVVPARPSGVAAVFGQLRAERLRFWLMRLSFVGVCLLSLLFLAWAVPWVPFGMRASHYSGIVGATLLLALTSSVSALVFVIVWVPQFRHESLPEFLRVLFGAHQLIRGRQQFESRLAAECRRARRDRRSVFSLIIIELPEQQERPSTGREQERNLAAMLVRSKVRADDIVADCRPREVWLLSVGAGHQACQVIIRRLARGLADSEESFHDACRIGSSSFDVDGQQPDELFSAAYERLAPLATLVEPASAAA